MEKYVLFLCTGNYYRSKFSEIYFNFTAQQKNINWRAFSRGFYLFAPGNIGWIASVAIDKLNELGIPIPKEFPSVLVNKNDFKRADMIIALSEKEHRPFMKHSFPEWENKIIYWDILDQHDVLPKIALQGLKDKIDNFLGFFMSKITLKKLEPADKELFAKWWRDEELIKRTSGILTPISDEQVREYLAGMLVSKTDHHFMITVDDKPIGHVVLAQRDGEWCETQIVIGEKDFWEHGYATSAMKELLEKAKSMGIRKVFLEVRPDNLGAIRVYEKCGFIKKGTIDYPDNPNLPKTLRMELDI